jgi:hypothetical protein
LWVQLDDAFDVEALTDYTLLKDDHTVGYEIDNMSIGEVVCLDQRWVSDQRLEFGRVSWALAHGLIPFQPFQVELFCHYYQTQTQDGAEWDCDCECEILERHGRSAEEVAEFYEKWLKETI